ncbi:FecR domain-containing protein [Paenibacillus sp. P25]|nr:FecR domain-containing protein [Paenibacillus sp. P25]
METVSFTRRGKWGPTTALIVVSALLLTVLSLWTAPEAQAKTVRAALVVEVTGDVKVKKAGGSKSYEVYKDMPLNQGDLITTGEASSAVLRIADRDDELTISANAEVYISELTEDGEGTASKLKAWAGSLWSKVKSLVSPDDRFEVETPTAVMGVRGTQFLTFVNPNTGETVMLVASGRVRAEADNGEERSTGLVTVYPAQQISLNAGPQQADLRTRVTYADIQNIVKTADPRVLEAFVNNIPDIQKENDGIKDKLLEQFQQGMEKPEQQSILKFSSPSDLEKVLQNFDAWIPSLVKEAVDANKIGANRIDDLNKRISDPEKRIDLNHIPKLDQAAGIDPLVEELKKQSGPESDSFAEEQRVIRDNRQRLSALLDKLEEDRRQIDQTNSQTSEQMNRQALEALLALLDPSARQQFLENQKKNGQTQTVSSSNSGGSSSGESSSSDSTPSAPQIVSPARISPW